MFMADVDTVKEIPLTGRIPDHLYTTFDTQRTSRKYKGKRFIKKDIIAAFARWWTL